MEHLMWKKFGQWVLVKVIDTRPEMILVQEGDFIPKWVDVKMIRLLTDEEKESL